MALDRAKLAKILELTGRDIDAEALAFMRKANEMAYAAGGWMEVLCPKPEPGPFGMQQKDFQQDKDGDWSPPHLTDKTIIETMFRAIYAQPRSDNEEFWQWVDSVHQFWLERHRLTPKQYSSIRKCYVRAVRSSQ